MSPELRAWLERERAWGGLALRAIARRGGDLPAENRGLERFGARMALVEPTGSVAKWAHGLHDGLGGSGWGGGGRGGRRGPPPASAARATRRRRRRSRSLRRSRRPIPRGTTAITSASTSRRAWRYCATSSPRPASEGPRDDGPLGAAAVSGHPEGLRAGP